MPGNVEGGGGIGIGAAPVSGTIDGGPAFGAAPIGRGFEIVNDWSIGRNEVENTMILTGNRPKTLGQIEFNNPLTEESVASEPKTLINFSLVDEAVKIVGQVLEPNTVTAVIEHPINKVKNIWEELRDQEDLTPDVANRAFLAAAAVGKSPQAFGWPSADLEYVTSVLQETTQDAEPIKANKGMLVAPYSAPHSSPQSAKVHEVLEEQEKKARKKDNSFVASEEEIETRRKRFVLDEGAQGVVIAEIRQAVRKASVLAFKLGRKITGFLIARFLPGQHPGNESEAVKGRSPDGSIPTRAEAIKKHGEFASYEEAEKTSIEAADEIPPIKVRNEGEGEPVKDENVYTVYKDHPVKPKLSEINLAEQLTATRIEVITEPRIEDYPDLEAALNVKPAA